MKAWFSWFTLPTCRKALSGSFDTRKYHCERAEGGVALDRLTRLGWIGDATWVALETAKDEPANVKTLEADTERKVGAARLTLLRKRS